MQFWNKIANDSNYDKYQRKTNKIIDLSGIEAQNITISGKLLWMMISKFELEKMSHSEIIDDMQFGLNDVNSSYGNLNFSQSKFIGNIDFSNTKFHNCDFSDISCSKKINLYGANFKNCKFKGIQSLTLTIPSEHFNNKSKQDIYDSLLETISGITDNKELKQSLTTQAYNLLDDGKNNSILSKS